VVSVEGTRSPLNKRPASHGPIEETSDATRSVGRRRWLICVLLLFAASVNYIDRQVLGLLKPTLQIQFGWTEIGYSNIVFAFQLSYAAGLLFVGKLIDRLGTRLGFSLAVLFWSFAAMAHAAAGSVRQFAAARISLGLGESGSFPASVKAVAEWFPKKERALATGIFNSGTNVGTMVAPLVVSFLTYRFGWRMAFIATGAMGFLWVPFWFGLYRRPEEDHRVAAAELVHIQSDREDQSTTVPLQTLLVHRQLWAVVAGRFFTDPIWYVYLFWMPDFLSRNLKLDLGGMRLPLFIIYTGASIGSVGGGWLSSSLLKRGWTVNASRKAAMLACALAVTPIVLAARTKDPWLAICLIAIAAGAHQGWSANLYTLVSDMFPRSAVASVVGFAGVAGAIGGMLIAKTVGYILQWTGSYIPVFMLAGLAYLIAFGWVQWLAPHLEPAQV